MLRKKNIVNSNQLGLRLFVILFLATGFSAFSQKTGNDSIKTKKPVAIHSPRRATLYSAVLPGLGQIYNRKYWKAPIVYGGFATLGYFINYNNNKYTKFKQAYSDIIDNDPNTKSYEKLSVYQNYVERNSLGQLRENLRTTKDYWRRNRDLVVIGTAFFYTLNIIDASVDANFFNFNIGEELTMNWAPAPDLCMNQKLIGFHCRFTF